MNIRTDGMRLFVVILLTILPIGCSADSSSTAANLCVSIGTENVKDAALIETFDEFALRQGMSIDRSSVGGREYMSDAHVISLTFGIGRYGTILALFSKEERSSLRDALRHLIDSEVATRWPVSDCEAIEGFRTPKLIPGLVP